jgi:hypothetical protein
MTVQYKTEGKLDLSSSEPHARTVCVSWVTSSNHVMLHSDRAHIQLTKNQLIELQCAVNQIVKDLT